VGESFATVYGFGDQGRKSWTEDDLSPVREKDAGLRAVVEALRSLEAQLLSANQQGRIESISLRYGMTYGPENPSTQYMFRMLHKLWVPGVRGADELTSWVHTADVVTATIAALECGRPGAIYNIADDEPVRFNQFLNAAAQAIGAPRPYTVPRWVLNWLAPYIVATVTSQLPLDNTRAKRELAWRPQFSTYREGLQQVARELQGQEDVVTAVGQASP
jgi:nucleoside-diphosphate-sugar epimerase